MTNELQNIETWFSLCADKLKIDLEKINFSDNADWGFITNSQGKIETIEHKSGRFHKVISLRAWDPIRKLWVDRCLLEPLPEGEENICGIIILAKYQNQFLVQAKAEPGNNTPHHVALTTTVQASFTNLNMALTGVCPFIELSNHPNCSKIKVIQDGAHFLNKTNTISFIELTEKPLNIPSYFYWATLEEIAAFAQKGLVSEHLMQALGALTLQSYLSANLTYNINLSNTGL